MPDVILHHYPPSLFSEKIRLLLGYCGVPWSSVIIPPIMPRPLLMPLTGGYRKTPVMQIGADVYCDSKIIAERIAELAGRTDLLSGFVAQRVGEWADTQLFRVVVAVTFQPRAIVATMSRLSSTEMQAFQKDRAELARGGSITTYNASVAEGFLDHYLTELESTLSTDFLMGKAPTIADFCVYHCFWLVTNNPVTAPLVTKHAKVRAWMGRMAAFGHGKVTEISGQRALDTAKAAEPMKPDTRELHLPEGMALGQGVAVTPTDYGLVPVHGKLVACSSREIAVGRRDDFAGNVIVHFPRAGFDITVG
jgi:glutathione S-transferase